MLYWSCQHQLSGCSKSASNNPNEFFSANPAKSARREGFQGALLFGIFGSVVVWVGVFWGIIAILLQVFFSRKLPNPRGINAWELGVVICLRVFVVKPIPHALRISHNRPSNISFPWKWKPDKKRRALPDLHSPLPSDLCLSLFVQPRLTFSFSFFFLQVAAIVCYPGGWSRFLSQLSADFLPPLLWAPNPPPTSHLYCTLLLQEDMTQYSWRRIKEACVCVLGVPTIGRETSAPHWFFNVFPGTNIHTNSHTIRRKTVG